MQAELRAKTGSPNLGPTHMPQNMVQPPPIQRTILGRHHARRSGSSIAPKVEPSPTSAAPSLQSLGTISSPKTRPTPPSHAASPTNPTPGFRPQMTASPTASDHPSLRTAVPPPMKPPMLPMQGPMAVAAARQQQMMQAGSGIGARQNPYYPTPSFQNHIEQLGRFDLFTAPLQLHCAYNL